MGAKSWLSPIYIVGASRLGGTICNLASGLKNYNTTRTVSAIMGLWSNAVYFLWGHNKTKHGVGDLSLVAGTWEQAQEKEYDVMVQTIDGRLPDEVISQMESWLDEDNLNPNILDVRYNKDTKKTKLVVRKDEFPKLQAHLLQKLENRKLAMQALFSEERVKHSEHQTIKGIDTTGLSEPIQKELLRILRDEWDIAAMFYENTQGSEIFIPKEDRHNFVEKRGPIAEGQERMQNANTVLVKNREKTYQPGFIEALTRPDKHPWQNSNLIGGIFSNVFKALAGLNGVDENRKPKVHRNETLGSIYSMIVYFVENQPEVKSNTKQDIVTVNAGVEVGKTQEMLNQSKDFLNERPVLTSMLIKIPMLYYRYKDGWENRAHDPAKLGQFFFDCLTALTSLTIKKSDYGR